MVFDPAIDKVVLTGGNVCPGSDQHSLAGEVWLYGGRGWTVVQTGTHPPVMSGLGAMTYDPITRSAIYFAYPPDDGSVQTWSFDGKRWRQLPTEGPRPTRPTNPYSDYVSKPFAVFDPQLGDAVLVQPDASGALWLFDGLRWRRGHLPWARANDEQVMGVAYDPAARDLVVSSLAITGRVHGVVEEAFRTWTYNGQRWTLLPPAAGLNPDEAQSGGPGPSPMFFDKSLGGLELYKTPYPDTLISNVPDELWLLKARHWHQIGAADGPPSRQDTFMAYDSRTDTAVLYGGTSTTVADGERVFSDTWSLHDSTWSHHGGSTRPTSFAPGSCY